VRVVEEVICWMSVCPFWDFVEDGEVFVSEFSHQ